MHANFITQTKKLNDLGRTRDLPTHTKSFALDVNLSDLGSRDSEGPPKHTKFIWRIQLVGQTMTPPEHVKFIAA